MADEKDLLHLVQGRKVIVSNCEAAQHGDNAGCVCSLKGTVQTMGKKREPMFVGTPTWHLEGSGKSVRLSEVTFVL